MALAMDSTRPWISATFSTRAAEPSSSLPISLKYP